MPNYHKERTGTKPEKIQRQGTLELSNPATGGLLTAPSLPKYSSKDDTYLPTKDEVVGEKKRKRSKSLLALIRGRSKGSYQVN
jgi:hypothetical protein